jgi:CheY-like chemotaxis protein
MHVRDWVICLIEPNKFEAQIMVDVLRGAGADKVKVFTDSAEAMATLEIYPANIIVAAVESLPMDGVAWTRALRRNQQVKNRKASVFLTSHAFSRSLAEDCRHAGANALIGKPISAKILTATIAKVLNHPRPFIDAANYVGPCRRAGIVTAGEPKRRRKVDSEAAAPQATLEVALVNLAQAAEHMLAGKGAGLCEAALKQVQGYAVSSSDGPMMRACAALTLQMQTQNVRPEIAREAVEACVAGMKALAALDIAQTGERDAIAESVRQAVAKAAARRAA